MRLTPLLLLAIAAALASACSDPDTQASSESPDPAAEPPAVAASPETPADSDPHADLRQAQGVPRQLRNGGEVLAAENAGGYTYMRVQTGDGAVWLASMQTDVSRGDQVAWGQAAVMQQFESKAMGRTFDQILFVQGVTKMDRQAQAAGDNSGQVLEVAEAGGYSFLKVRDSKGDGWIAAPQTSVAIGDTVRWSDGAVMQDFASPSLDRTFDEILFSGGITVVK